MCTSTGGVTFCCASIFYPCMRGVGREEARKEVVKGTKKFFRRKTFWMGWPVSPAVLLASLSFRLLLCPLSFFKSNKREARNVVRTGHPKRVPRFFGTSGASTFLNF